MKYIIEPFKLERKFSFVLLKLQMKYIIAPFKLEMNLLWNIQEESAMNLLLLLNHSMKRNLLWYHYLLIKPFN